MLTELRISHFALFEHLHLKISHGFLVFTGETGAGKSLLIDALLLLVGGRASIDHIRHGADEALLEASFFLPESHPLEGRLRNEGYLLPDQRDILIRRILSRAGKNRVYLNGQLAPLQTLQAVGGQLVDIHGQHEQQSLLSPKHQLSLLDAYGGLNEHVSKFQQAYEEWVSKTEELDALQTYLKEQTNRQDMMEFQLNELSTMALRVGEEEELTQEYHRMKHAGRLGELSHQAFERLTERDDSVLAQLSSIKKWVQELSQIDTQRSSWASLIESAELILREASDHLRDYRLEIDYDPERTEAIDQRLAGLQHLKKKYGKSIEDLLDWVSQLEQDLQTIQQGDDRVAQLQQTVDTCWKTVNTLGQDLSAQRKATASNFVARLHEELRALHMETLKVDISIDTTEDAHRITPSGMDQVEIQIAPNPGEPFLPLARIASGGELSRIMLALKTVLAGNDHTPVLIFDEIDSGVGGEAGLIMGTRLRQLAQYHQVGCVTHLPQIAAQAHHQYVVEKSVGGGRTQTLVREIKEAERPNEIARMLGGEELTPTLKKTARELLKKQKG